jgi:hypothetical protein
MPVGRIITSKNRKFHIGGRKRPKIRALVARSTVNIPQEYLDKLPDTCDWSAPAQKSTQNVMLNNQLGCCCVSGKGHIEGWLTANSGTEVNCTDAQITAMYGRDGGYVPGQPSTDNGCDEQTCLNNAETDGVYIGFDKWVDWLAVDPTQPEQYRGCVYYFGNLYYGIELPDQWISSIQNNMVWDAGTPDPNNGHCVPAYGFDTTGTKVDTWGLTATITDAAHTSDVVSGAGGELYVIFSMKLFDAKGFSPCGLYYDELAALWVSMGGKQPPANPFPPNPKPAPGPQPTPPGPAPAPPSPPAPAGQWPTYTGTLSGLPGTITLIPSAPTGKADLKPALTAAGLTGALIYDVEQLITDIAAGATPAVIFDDVVALLNDIAGNRQKEVAEKS